MNWFSQAELINFYLAENFLRFTEGLHQLENYSNSKKKQEMLLSFF